MLVQYTSDDERRCWPLNRITPITIGRDDSCAVALPLRPVSRHHARIIWFQDRYVIEDLGSTNGTFVNGGQCYGPLTLQDGDEIQLGCCAKLCFLDEETTEPLVPHYSGLGLRIDHVSRSFSIDGVPSAGPLSPPQFNMLKVIFDAQGEIVSREEIIDAVWPEVSHNGVSEQAIDAVIRRIRLRIAELDSEHKYVVTVRGYGFRFVQKSNHI